MIWTRHRPPARAMLLLLASLGVAFAPSASPASSAAPAAEPQATAAATPTATAAIESGAIESGVATPTETPDPELLTRYCIRCHSDRLRTGGLTLEHADVNRIADDPELWEKIAWKVRIGAMPKVPAPRPERPVLDRFASAVEGALDRAAAASPDPGPPTFHRLNRLQYVNAVRDFLGVEVDGPSLLPPDATSYGFDNNRGLTITPSLLDRYLAAAVRIARAAVGDPTIPPTTETYRIEQTVRQGERMSEDLPFGTNGGLAVRHTFPLDGEYAVRVLLPGMGTGALYSRPQSEVLVTVDGATVKHWSLEPLRGRNPAIAATTSPEEDAPRAPDEDLVVRFAAKAGTRPVGVTLLNIRPAYAEGLRGGVVGDPGPVRRGASGRIESLTVSGPFHAATPEESESRRRIFTCRPTASTDERACARQILTRLARRGFRRPVAASDVEGLLPFYEEGRRAGGFDAGIQAALERLLISPQFLFRIERGPDGAEPNTIFRVSDVELASRLSFFLWSSPPDEELLGVAERGRLGEPAVLTAQTRRMLADPRAAQMAAGFAGQWLGTRLVRELQPDPTLYPLDANLQEALARETELFFESQLREDRSVPDLLEADYTYLNERLAAHYGIPNVYGSHMRRVTLTDDRRFGILGMGGVLMVTSHANRTSPVVRGKWIMDNLVANPPPPPPADIPPLPENDGELPTTVRERLEQHRANPVCASCHTLMDPFGFALENFDVTGQWRDVDNGIPVDASGVALDGSEMDGVVGLRRALLANRTQFATVFTERLLTYALGRGVDARDRPAVRAIVREAAPDFRWSDIILGIVTSSPFRMNRTPGAEPGATATVASR
ncbi:MAG: DUF1592 domain-containing protein [Acidobacteria bacterium]|nr:DUF1592 domain-containing protein [Acidobacteriota bacterium]